MSNFKLALLFPILAFQVGSAFALDAAVNGSLYGDVAGLARVAAFEDLLHSMTIQTSHPRIILTPELIARARQRVAAGHKSWAAIKNSAVAGNTLNAAFAFVMLQASDPTQAAAYATRVYNNIMAATATPWPADYDSGTVTPDRKVAEWSIAFDWVYNGLTSAQRSDLIAKIGAHTNIAGRAAWIRSGGRDTGANGDTFHREEWIFFAWRAWPELALANHVTDADFCYKTRWRYDWAQGDIARAYAYLNDGTPLEGYQYGADATAWFMALKSATGINLVDGPVFHYDLSAADYQLYAMDFGLNRNVFHHGVGSGAGGVCTYSDTLGNNTNWKLKEYHSMATQLAAHANPYQQWFAKNPLTFDTGGATSWIFTNEYYNRWSDFENISTVLFYDPSLASIDPRTATYEQLPFAKHFEGGNEVYMRSSWGNDAAMACFRTAPAFTKSSHGDFDVNTFILYRKGNLAPDSGVYDNSEGQTNYFKYQKNTVAHNNLLVVDPANPNSPTKLSSSSPDPGGTELVSTRTFGNIHPVFPSLSSTFLLNPKANWGDIVAFQSHKEFDYSVGEAAKAYGSRLDEYTRSLVFVRKPGDKAYVLVYDRVNATQPGFKKKWLLHTVNEPSLNGSIVNTEVAGHIFTTDGDSYSATNAFNNSALYGKTLLPANRLIRKIGGTGYEFWVDGSTPKNWPIDWPLIASHKEPYMGGPLQEIGQWRLEVMPSTQQQRDLFFNVIYLGDVGETLAPVTLLRGNGFNGALIDDAQKPTVVLFGSAPHGTAIPAPIHYTVNTSGQNVQHIISNVRPNVAHQIVYSVNGSVVDVQISSGATSGGMLQVTASPQGVLYFVTNSDLSITDPVVPNPTLPDPVIPDPVVPDPVIPEPPTADVIAPSVSISSPASGTTVRGSIVLAANAADNIGVKKVEFYLNSTRLGIDSASPYAITWDSAAAPSGTYALTARAYDAAGNVTRSEPVSLIVGRVPKGRRTTK